MPPKPPAMPPARSFRILALPLTRLAPPPQHTAAPHPATPLMLFHTIQPEPHPDSTPSLANKVLNKSSDTWLNLGEKPKDSWMYWFYARGEKLMDRIEYEEWALKAIKEGEGVKVSKEGQVLEKVQIPLLLPQLQGQSLPSVVPKLHRHLLKRIPHHKKMMYRALIFSPLTWPFAIIPIIPNFPLFYVLWRAWSHYKAWRGATYLEQLLKAGLIVETKCPELTEIYAGKGKVIDSESASGEGLNAPLEKGGAVDGTATPDSMISARTDKVEHGTTEQPMPPPAPGPITSQAAHPSLLLLPSQIPLLAKTFNLKAIEVVDVTRAVEQANLRTRKAEEASNKVEEKEK